jgi:DNA-binding CsgD family transcriptional regulator
MTARQRECFGLVVRGLSNAEIAATLMISQQTVKNHMTVITRKFGVRNRADLRVAGVFLALGVEPVMPEDWGLNPRAPVVDPYGFSWPEDQ